ncbi:exocyst complex component Sec10-like protein, partial [Jimgerdemannia flammicorona]
MVGGGVACVQTFIQKHPMFFDNPFNPLDNFRTMKEELKTQSRLIGEVFPASADVYYVFGERVFEDVVEPSGVRASLTEYVTTLLENAFRKDTLLYLTTTSLVFKMSMHLADVMITGKPVSLDKERAHRLVFRMYEPLMDDYLDKEEEYIKMSYKSQIEQSTNLANEHHISNQSREVYKRNYLSAFRKLIALPVDLVSSAATSAATTISSIASPKTRSETVSPSLSPTASVEDLTRMNSPPPATASPSSGTATGNMTPPLPAVRKPGAGPVDKVQQEQLQTRRFSLSRDAQNSRTSREFSAVELQGALNYAKIELDQLQNLLSLDMALQMIHLNKEAERRLERFMINKFPGKSAARTATDRLGSYKPDADSLGQDDVAPLRQFFELVHIADLIQQMLDVYFDEEIFVDRQDFMNEVNKEKKAFERLTDDCVANGLDRSIQVLMDQCDFILSHEQKPSDFNPTGDTEPDLNSSESPVLPYFAALRSLANIYIISSPGAIKDVIHDIERFNGVLRVEDVYEFATCRADWQQIRKQVETERLECSSGRVAMMDWG